MADVEFFFTYGECGISPFIGSGGCEGKYWFADEIFYQGQIVSFKGHNYIAQENTKVRPGVGAQWQYLSPCGLLNRSAQNLLDLNFQNSPLGAYTAPQFIQDWAINPSDSSGVSHGRLNIGAEQSGEQYLDVTYSAGGIGGSSASVFKVPLGSQPLKELWLQYKVYFPENFNWVKGGKLPRLSGYLTGKKPTGCVSNADIDGFSARFMWREDGHLLQYLYHPEKSERCGDYYSTGKFLQKSRWHTITSHITLNVDGHDQDRVDAYLDGELVLTLTDLALTLNNAEASINYFLFETFFGGGSASWAPQVEQHAYFDDVVISTQSPLGRVVTQPAQHQLSEAEKASYVEWTVNSGYDEGSKVWLNDQGYLRYFVARYGIAAGKNPLDYSMPAKFEGVYSPVRLDTGKPWLEQGR